MARIRGLTPASMAMAALSCAPPNSERSRVPLIRRRWMSLFSCWMVAGMVLGFWFVRSGETLRLACGCKDGSPPATPGIEALGLRGEEFDGDVDKTLVEETDDQTGFPGHR